MRREQCFQLLVAGQQTLPHLLATMYGHFPPQARLGGLGMLVGYLDLLAAENRITERLRDGIRHYLPSDTVTAFGEC
jgi:hypothetical protein